MTQNPLHALHKPKKHHVRIGVSLGIVATVLLFFADMHAWAQGAQIVTNMIWLWGMD